MTTRTAKIGLLVAGAAALSGGLWWALRGRRASGRFRGTGRPRALGHAQKTSRALGLVEDYGESRTATLLVGRNRGHQPSNRSGRCAREPRSYSLKTMDSAFLKLRAAQVGKANTGATRTSGKGWFEGKPEQSAAYEVVFIPSNAESTYSAFKTNMNRLAEKLGERLCQDSVIAIHSDGDKQRTYGATWYR